LLSIMWGGLDKMTDYLLFPFRAVASFFYCLWGGIQEWRQFLVVQRRFLDFKYGKGSTTPYEQILWEWDQEAEIPEVGDHVSFYDELWGVVDSREVWGDNTLRFSVQVHTFPSQRYLRPHEIDQIVKGSLENGN